MFGRAAFKTVLRVADRVPRLRDKLFAQADEEHEPLARAA